MTIQLPIVVSHSQKSNNVQREFEESLVTRLMLDEGADVRLIGNIGLIDPESTDLLMLEGIGGAFALLSWESPDKALQALQNAGIPGRRAAHRGDPSTPQENGRPIYFMDLSSFANAIDQAVDLIKACAQDQTVKTVTLVKTGSTKNKPRVLENPLPPRRLISPDQPNSSPPILEDPIRGQLKDINDAPEGSDLVSASEDVDLDSLVQDLDNLDL